jgi:regulator of sigma E protease
LGELLQMISSLASTALGFIVVFGTIVFFHELGHYTAAKLTGMRVFEFALGFGPSILRREWHHTLYSIRAIPLGGFVKVAGMDPTPDSVEGEIPTNQLYSSKALWQKLLFIASGALMNFVLAFLLLATYHMTITIPPTVQTVIEGSPAAEIGVKLGDQIVAVGDTPTPSTDLLVKQIQVRSGEQTVITIRRGKEQFEQIIIPQLDEERQVGVIGVELYDQQRQGLLVSVRRGVQETYHWSVAILKSVGDMITGRTRAELSGPVGIIVITGSAVQEGLDSVLRLAILLNINLGLFNLFPIPLLDGFWIVIAIIEAARRKPLEPAQKGIAQLVGLGLLLLLLGYATYQDVARFIVG